jgi:predicted DNA binding CopG/RHH family protein
MKRSRKRENRLREIKDYDDRDTSSIIDPKRPLTFADLGLSLPKAPPTQVVSIRLPSTLLNELRAFASERDVPYQALIKLLLAESLTRRKRKAA